MSVLQHHTIGARAGVDCIIGLGGTLIGWLVSLLEAATPALQGLVLLLTAIAIVVRLRERRKERGD